MTLKRSIVPSLFFAVTLVWAIVAMMIAHETQVMAHESDTAAPTMTYSATKIEGSTIKNVVAVSDRTAIALSTRAR